MIQRLVSSLSVSGYPVRYLQYLVPVKPLLLPAAKAAGSSNGLTRTRSVNTVVCAPDDGWRYHPKNVEQFRDINKLFNVASCWIYIGICYVHLHYIDPKPPELSVKYLRQFYIYCSMHHNIFYEITNRCSYM